MLQKIKQDLHSRRNSEKAIQLQRFFKTGKGEYGEGDIFIGVIMPEIRKVAKNYFREIGVKQIEELLQSKLHEERMLALVMLTEKYKRSKKDKLMRRIIFETYLKNTHKINNWDLVDVTCQHIVGDFCLKDGTEILKFLARSKNLWERRIAMVASGRFIKENKLGETLAIAEMLLNDEHDLMHKAVGWMLREVGKKNEEVLEIFLKPRYNKMPRTMLRYAIEKFPEDERKKWLRGEA